MALDELSNILDKVPKQTHGDFNIDLHDSNSKNIQDYENAIFSKGIFPTISTVTHEKPGCKPHASTILLHYTILNLAQQ